MTPFASLRVAAAAAGLGIAVLAGFGVVPLAARQASVTPAEGTIPIGWPMNQAGSSVTLREVQTSPAWLCGTAVVRNDADRAVTSLQFVGALTAFGPRPSGIMSLSDRLDVRIEPGEQATVSPNVVPQSEARWRMAQNQIQVMCGLVGVQFENGFVWSSTPNPSATTADEMLGLPRVDLPRALVGQPAGPNPNLCFDEAQREYSQGAIIGIRNEPGRFARCEAGAWVDDVLPGLPPAAR